MATFKEIRGQLIKKYTTNPTNPLEGQIWYNSDTGTLKGVVTSSAWSSASPLSTGRESMGRGGTQTDALVFGGDGDGPTPVFRFNATEEYNGTGWATGGDLPVSINNIAGSSAGSTTAAFGAGGYITAKQSATYEYDGSTWTSGGALGTARSFTPGVGAGTLTAGLVFAGDTYPPASRNSVLTEEYNGASWTAGGVLGSGGYSGMGAGTQTAAVWKGGGPGPTPGTYVSHYNGTSWTEQGAAPFASVSGSYGGPQTSGIASGGIPTPSFGVKSFTYDGSTWTAAPDLAIARYNQGSAGASNTSSLVVGGRGPLSPAFYVFTEEFNTSATVITPAAWASAPALNNARKAMYSGNIGTPTSALAVGSSPASNLTEEYDGSSWTVQNVAPASLYGRGGAGTQTAALTFGGNPNPSVVTTTAEYDGANWTTGGALNTGRGYGPIGAGTQTAGMAIGGWNPALPTYPPGYVTTVEFYNGASWTNNPVAGPSIYGGAGSGTQAAAWVAGSASVSPEPANQQSYEWDGSSWTAGGLYTMAAVANIFGGGPTTTAWVAAGDADPGLKVATSHYDGTAWSTAPNMATARDNGASTGANTASLAIGGGTPPASTTVEEFSGATSAANIKTITTS